MYFSKHSAQKAECFFLLCPCAKILFWYNMKQKSRLKIKNKGLCSSLIKTKNKKMRKNISSVFVLLVIIITTVFFGVLTVKTKRQMSEQQVSFPVTSEKSAPTEKLPSGSVSVSGGKTIEYVNSELGFKLILPSDGKRYAVKEASPQKLNRAVLFGLPTGDAKIKESKKEAYSEIFRIELVPISDLKKKTCASESREFPLCDNDDAELGRNENFVFVYTRYDKLDAVEKNKAKFVPEDFSPEVFATADEIVKSFSLIPAQTAMAL